MKISDKDWNRMLDLVLASEDGAKTAKVLKDKNKAIARFVCGVKLNGDVPRYNEGWNEFSCSFDDFGNKALKLGATREEIQSVFDDTHAPQKFIDKKSNLRGKNLTDRFVGDISRAILKLGFDITYLPHDGNAITNMGMDAMERNGRKWTIGYKAVIDTGAQKFNFVFDAITDEGNGPTSYVIAQMRSANIFDNFNSWEKTGKLKFIKQIKEALVS